MNDESLTIEVGIRDGEVIVVISNAFGDIQKNGFMSIKYRTYSRSADF